MKQWIFGHHAVQTVLETSNRPLHGLFVTKKNLERYAPSFKGKVHILSPQEMDKKFPNKVHQGVALQVGALTQLSLEDILDSSNFLLILDQVTDPHNLGACLRSANAFGVDAVITPHHGSASLTDVAAKASAGASEMTPIIQVPNLNKALDLLKKSHFWIVGLDGYAHQELSEIDLTGKLALVMGNEGRGLRQLVKKNCDFTAKLPMIGEVESLNVSVAAGVSLYEATKQRKN